MEQIQFQSYDQPEGFRPVKRTDVTAGLDRRNAQLQRDEAQFLQGLKANTRTHIINAEQQGKDLIALSEFSKSALELAEGIYKKSEEDKEIGEMYDALVGGGFEDTPQAKNEQALIQQSGQEAEQINAIASNVEEQTGDVGLATSIRQDFGGAGRGFVGERTALMQAQTTYPAYISAYLSSNAEISVNGNTVPVRQAVSSGDSRLIAAAIASGRRQFIKDNGLQYATKTNFVKMLGQTILNADAQAAGAASREAAKANQEELRSTLEGTGYASGRSIDTSLVPQTYRDLADTMWKSGAYKSRGEANEAALKSLIAGMEDKGDVDGLRSLLTTEKIEGNAGTQLRSQYGQQIHDAIQRAEKRQDDIITEGKKDIEASMYERLGSIDPSAPNAVQMRDDIIEDAASALEANGDYKGARELRSQRDALVTAGNNQRENAELEQQIEDGEIVSAEQVEQAFVMGRITRSQRNARLKQLGEKTDTKTPSNPIATDLVSTYASRFTQDLGMAAGLKRDAYGNFIDGLAGDSPLLTAAEARVLQGQAKVDLRIIANRLLRENPGMSDQ